MNAIDTALYNCLAAGTALTTALGGTFIYQAQAPRSGTLPWVIFNMQSGIEDNETPARTDRFVYLVKAVAPTMLQAGTLAVLCDSLVHGQTLTVSGYSAFWVRRESHVHYMERDAVGNTLAHSGAEYAIRVEVAR